MHFDKIGSGLFEPENMKYVEINNVYNNPNEKNFVRGVWNAQNLLEGLERSLCKSQKYQERLFRCKATHAHSHDWWASDRSTGKEGRGSESETTKASRGHLDLSESWSTMSIVCLQYQYEELSKKYAALFHAYHEINSTAVCRSAALARLRGQAKCALAQLGQAHCALIAVGDRYLDLRRKKQLQKRKYEARVKQLQATVRGVRAMCELARRQLDTGLARALLEERSAPAAQLLVEIRKCNLLFMENLKLKAHIEELAPGKVFEESEL